MARRFVCMFVALTLLAHGFCIPTQNRLRRQTNELQETTETPTETTLVPVHDISLAANNDVASAPLSVPIDPKDDADDDDDDDDIPQYPSGGGGSNIGSLFNILGAILPSSSSSSVMLRNIIRTMIKRFNPHIILRREINADDVEFDYVNDLKPPPLQRQEENSESEDSRSESSKEEANSEQDSNSNIESDEDDYDEPPGGGDGQGGGLLGLLAGLSGGEDGQSDLGSLLATVSGIIANLSGDGIDLNSLIASGIGLFVGLLSEGDQYPGTVIASYLLTSLDTITGGGSKNNGAFFGNFLSKLIVGTSAAGDPDASSEENGRPQMKDSAGFFASLLMSLLGEMSKSSSGGSSHPWKRSLEPNRRAGYRCKCTIAILDSQTGYIKSICTIHNQYIGACIFDICSGFSLKLVPFDNKVIR
ncbi:uncharacterized protein LOC119835780 [Zerene cesonia]|uniref:uncharacterized protein LOC119835780 n=1 Tax=Zerene cesonia TaxID=33412 RepID=UPI0018E51CA9|nr:uncharacterized protein LOC119835780 [Zerene cesonia]